VGEVLTSTKCSVCGKPRLVSIPTCPHCGAVERIERSVLGGTAVAWVDSFPLEMKQCPVCGSQDVIRVKALVKSANPMGADVVARELAAPSKPGFGSWQYLAIPLVIGVAGAFLSFGVTVAVSAFYLAPYKGMTLPDWDRAVCWIVPLAFLAFGPLVARRLMLMQWQKNDERSEDSDLKRWSRQMEAWERLYYCHACDHVTDPLVGRSTTPHGMLNLLNR
jgi:hypothetical protein